MRRTEREAIALGLLHGPVELLPVSSSGHVEALPWLLDWEIAGWDGARRKELAVGLHAGSLLGLALLARPPRLAPILLAAAGGPPALDRAAARAPDRDPARHPADARRRPARRRARPGGGRPGPRHARTSATRR